MSELHLKTRDLPLLACTTPNCRVATFTSTSALAKCPACDVAGIHVRYPIDQDRLARADAVLAARRKSDEEPS